MTRIHHVFLCAAVIVLMLTAGCTVPNNSPAPALIGQGTVTTVVPVPTGAEPAATNQPGAAGTQPPGTCSADVSADAANCGGCGYACPANALCQAGQCYCSEGFVADNNTCVAAPAGTGTGNGCPAGMSPCPDGYCYELASSPDNCGICGNVCPTGMTCNASSCTNIPAEVTTTVTTTTTINPGGFGTTRCFIRGTTNCKGTCVNLTSNNGNCGSCGTICSGLSATCCNGKCTSLKSDVNNCGTCGHTCSIVSICDQGSCKVKSGIIIRVSPTIAKFIDPQLIGPIGP
jgi:hypothetical protein